MTQSLASFIQGATTCRTRIAHNRLDQTIAALRRYQSAGTYQRDAAIRALTNNVRDFARIYHRLTGIDHTGQHCRAIAAQLESTI